MEQSQEIKMEITQPNSDQMTFEQYQQLAFANLKRSIIQDLKNNREESVMFKKYTIEQVVTYLENPQKNAKQLRTMSKFLYVTSSHYYRLINYYAKLATLNYIVVPTKLPDKINKKTFTGTYKKVIYQFEKYNIKHEIPKIMAIALMEGVFYGLSYESTDSFYIMPFNSEYAKITTFLDGTLVFSMDLDYFNTRKYLLSSYGEEIENAYWRYKGNSELGIQADNMLRWYEPGNGVCIKMDETDMINSLPVFCSLFLDIFRLDDYKLLKKAKTTLDNYKVLAMKIECDEEGRPKMEWEKALKYYNHASANIPEGIGMILSPFAIQEFSFQKSAVSEEDSVNQSENEFWAGSGTHGMMFGSTKASSASSLELSTKPDEELSFGLLLQIARYFNRQVKLKDYPYIFEMKFLIQTIFNKKDVQDAYHKAATYGISGAKLYYAASIDMTPSDVVNLAYLENDILEVTTKMFTSPLISSNTVSHKENSAGGAPTTEEKGDKPTDATEKSRENDGNNEN